MIEIGFVIFLEIVAQGVSSQDVLAQMKMDADSALAEGRVRASLAIYMEAQRIAPEESWPSLGAGKACEKLGDLSCAMDNFEKAQKLLPLDLELAQRIREIRVEMIPVSVSAVGSSRPHSPIAAAFLGFFPGMGQFYNGQKVKGRVFLFGEVFFIAGTAWTFVQAENARLDYKHAGAMENFDVLAQAFEEKKETNRIFFWSTVGIASLSALDSYFSSKKIQGSVKPAARLGSLGVEWAFAY